MTLYLEMPGYWGATLPDGLPLAKCCTVVTGWKAALAHIRGYRRVMLVMGLEPDYIKVYYPQ